MTAYASPLAVGTAPKAAIGYRPEIDGLRAISVLIVVFFHAEFSKFSGGYVGVDVFFVISGYLITSILLKDLRSATFSIRRFYERRARRILPALISVSATCAVLAPLIMFPHSYREFSQELLSVNLFISNFFFWRESGYFDSPAQIKPLLHTWSLAVEEQFYVILPVILFFSWRYFKDRLVLLFVLATVVSFAYAEIGSRYFASSTFYLLPGRAWELGVGGFIAALEFKGWTIGGNRWFRFAPDLGLALILLSVVILDDATRHPSFYTLLPVSGAALIIAIRNSGNLTNFLLSSSPAVFVGKISYSLYLWHYPVFVFYRIWPTGELKPTVPSISFGTYCLLIIVSFGLSVLSWRHVETPFRDRGLVSRKGVALFSLCAMCALGAVGAQGWTSGGWPDRFPPLVNALLNVQMGYTNLEGEDCRKESCVFGDKTVEPSFLVTGDSHAAMLSRSIARASKANGISGVMFAEGDIYLDQYPEFYESDESHLDTVREIISRETIGTVILIGRYPLRLHRRAFNNGEGGIEYLPESYDGRSEEEERELLHLYRSTVVGLLSASKRVVLVYPVPEVGWRVPETLFNRRVHDPAYVLSVSYASYRERAKRVVEAFDQIGQHEGLLRIYPDQLFCDTYLPERCATHWDDVVFYHDDDHLSIAGSDLLVDHIFARAREKWGSISATDRQ